MSHSISWSDGLLDYKQHTITIAANLIAYNCHLQDKSLSPDNFDESFRQILEKFVFSKIELLYSGGLDSEFVLVSLKNFGYPVVAVTMKLMCRGYPINTHDLYYSEKFCRQNNIEQRFIELDIEKFFESGRYQDYLLDYYIQQPHVATHFWMFEQCDNFPILAGEYSWPWVDEPILSPHRLEYSCYDRFLADNSINGIGNLLNYSYNINRSLISAHIELYKQNFILNDRTLPIFKKNLYQKLSNYTFEVRMRNSGWENLPKSVFNKSQYRVELIRQHNKISKSAISWNLGIAKLLNGNIYSNDRYS
jgi:hypothetical protein